MKTSNKILTTTFLGLLVCAISTMAYVRANSVLEKDVTAEGKISVQHYDIQDLHTLDIQIGNVTLYQGEPYVEIKCADNIREYLDMEVKDGTLTFRKLERAHGKIDIKISTKDIKTISLFGSSSLNMEGVFKTDVINISASNGSSITLPLEANIINVDSGADAEISLSGQSAVVNASVNNSANINASNLEANVVNAIVSDGSLITTVKEKLIVDVSRSGEVLYKGDPEIEIINQTDSGKITKL